MVNGIRAFFFFSSRRRHTRFDCDWSSDVCSSDLGAPAGGPDADGVGDALDDEPAAFAMVAPPSAAAAMAAPVTSLERTVLMGPPRWDCGSRRASPPRLGPPGELAESRLSLDSGLERDAMAGEAGRREDAVIAGDAQRVVAGQRRRPCGAGLA